MSTRILGAVLCGSLACAVSVFAQGVPVTSVSGASLARPVAPNAAELMLSQRVESVDWVENTFEEVLDWLREQSGNQVNVVPRWARLGVEGVGLDTPVTLKLSNTTVGDVLNETLMQVSDTGEVTYHGFANKLIISTKADFDRKLYTRIYDVTDILLRVPDFGEGAPAIDLQQAQQSTSGGGGGQSVFQGQGGQEQSRGGQQAEQEIEKRLDKLSKMITESIAPQSWNIIGNAAAGGGPGRIRIFNQSLVITTTIEVHEQIAGRFRLASR